MSAKFPVLTFSSFFNSSWKQHWICCAASMRRRATTDMPPANGLKEVIGHIIDSERVFAYRALVFSRNDNVTLPGFDQDLWAGHANHSTVPLKELAGEFESVRRSTIGLFRHLDTDAWMRGGTANNNPITVRALAYLIGGHTEHHLEILKSRYLGN